MTRPEPPSADDAAALTVFLTGADATAALAELARSDLSERNSPALVTELRRRFAPWQASALLTQARLRARAEAKWPFAASLLLVEEALEQATAWPVALYRAERIDRLAPPGPLLELGCGIGGDTLALATRRPVTAWEVETTRATLARANTAAIAASGLSRFHPVTVQTGDWTQTLAAGDLPFAAAFVDPARRTTDSTGGARRQFSLHTMVPPLRALLPLAERLPLLVVKAAPGLSKLEVPAEAAVQFVSHAGTAKEAVLWMGGAAAALPRRWAGVHDGQRWHEVVAGEEPAPALAADELPVPGALVWEPDPAVVRAGALNTLCARLGARLFAPDIAYLVGDGEGETTATPFAAGFRLIEAAPFNLKRLNERLRALGAGSVELKKRGFPQEPETLRKRLRLLPGGRPLVVLLTRRGDRHWMLLAERVKPAATSEGEAP